MKEGWMKNDEGWRLNDEEWRLNDEGWWFVAVEGFWFMTDEQTIRRMDICDCRAAFATENLELTGLQIFLTFHNWQCPVDRWINEGACGHLGFNEGARGHLGYALIFIIFYSNIPETAGQIKYEEMQRII